KALQHQQGIPLSSDDAPRSFGEDRDHNIWIGYNSGVARYRDGKFRFFKGGEEVPPGSIMGMFSDRRGRFWITSARSGLIRIDDPSAEQLKFETYTTNA